MALPHIIIVGGGAGGLELAAKLGRKLGRKNKALITLVDSSPTHLWKPLLHEIAAGTLNSYEDELDYMVYASSHYFQFQLGTLQGLQREKKQIILAPILNDPQKEIIPQRVLHYDILIIAVGSLANDFNVPGVQTHCLFLDNRKQADYLHNCLLKNLMRLSYQNSEQPKTFQIAVVGAGATGIELIAELHYSIRLMSRYGLNISPDDISFILIEAGKKLLPALPEHLSALILEELQRLNIHIYMNERVTEVTAEGFFTIDNKFIAADLKIWSAGIKAPDFLRNLDGLAVNSINQLLVQSTLQTTLDNSIFALGDCASCPQQNNQPVPPRAQVAHQQANFLVKILPNYLANKPLPAFNFHDYGSLISISRYETLGGFMGKITRNIMLEGKLARWVYLSLYKKHQTALYGLWRVIILTGANILSRKIRPRLKLH